MTIKKALIKLISDNNSTQTDLAMKLGYKRQSSISSLLFRGNLTVETLQKICNVYGYEITIQPKRIAGARPKGQIVFTDETEETDE